MAIVGNDDASVELRVAVLITVKVTGDTPVTERELQRFVEENERIVQLRIENCIGRNPFLDNQLGYMDDDRAAYFDVLDVKVTGYA